MNRRLLALLLAACMVFGLFGCTADPAPTGTTAPEASAADIYNQARAAVDEAANLQLTITSSQKRSVGGETYTESATQTLSLQGIGSETFQATLEDTTTMGEYQFSTTEYYSAGTVWTKFDGQLFTSELDAESYASRLAPAVLLDASLYTTITKESTENGTTIHFSDATAGESWLVPEGAEDLTATGTAVLDGSGNLVSTEYQVSYRYGSTVYEQNYSVAVTIPETLELSNPLTASEEEYVKLEFVDAPWLLYRAMYDVLRTTNLTYTSIDTMICYAGGVIFSQQENLDLYGTGEDTMSKYTVDINLQDYTGASQEYSIEELIVDGVLKYTENENEPISRMFSAAQISAVRKNYVDVVLDFLWSPEDITGATITDLGSVYLLEFTGNDALGKLYEANAVKTFFGKETFLMDLASDYRTETLNGYLSIDKYSGLPVSFGFTYEGVHTLDGQEYILSDQWDQTFFLGSNTAYEAITEEPLPDVEPENKPTPLFYHVTGPDGQEMWLFGTIHVGDDRTAFLPQEIYDALLASDALAVEFNSEAFDEALENDPNLLAQVQAAYFYGNGGLTKDHLDEEIYEDAVKLLKATGNYFMNAEYLKPYLWAQSIDNFMLRQGYNLVSAKGVDNRLMDFARENGIEIRDIESGLFQIQMITGFSDKLQELLLEDSLYTDSAAYCASVLDLYEKWCAGDEAVLRAELSNEVDTSEFTEEEMAEYEEQKPYIDEYNKAMSYDRNEDMLQVAIQYLESGEVIFYAVGLAHLLDNENGLVDALREAGYTVELVTFD